MMTTASMTRKILLCICGLLLCVVAFGVYSASTQKRTPETVIDAVEVIPHLKDGDILCRLGDRIWSAQFRDLSPTDKRFSHLGIVRIREGNLSVIHAEAWTERPEGVNEVSLEEFLQLALAIGIYRANFIEGSLLSDTALEYKGRPFDWNFDLNEENKLYCTELLYVILKRVAPDRTLKTRYIQWIGKDIILVDAISESDDFEEILVIRPYNN